MFLIWLLCVVLESYECGFRLNPDLILRNEIGVLIRHPNHNIQNVPDKRLPIFLSPLVLVSFLLLVWVLFYLLYLTEIENKFQYQHGINTSGQFIRYCQCNNL